MEGNMTPEAAAPPDTMIIRPAQSYDVMPMTELLMQLFSIEKDFVVDPRKQSAGLTQLLQDPRANILVAEIDGKVVAMIQVQTLISTAEGGKVGLVEDLVVHHDWRKRGIGRRLLDAVECWAQEQGMTRLQLLTDHDNANALNFYEHAGWQKTHMICIRRVVGTGGYCG